SSPPNGSNPYPVPRTQAEGPSSPFFWIGSDGGGSLPQRGQQPASYLHLWAWSVTCRAGPSRRKRSRRRAEARPLQGYGVLGTGYGVGGVRRDGRIAGLLFLFVTRFPLVFRASIHRSAQ